MRQFTGDYSPWRHVGDAWPHFDVSLAHLGGASGVVCAREGIIILADDLDTAGRRSTLAHELAHLDLAHHDEEPAGPDAPRLGRRRERAADRLAARRLIPLELLAYALRWSRDEHELADELWVDVATVRTRLAGLTDTEKAWIEREVWA